MKKRAVLYARVSGDDRKNSTSSLEGQLELCREYAKSNGWEVVEELAEDDRGASGASFDLPQLNRALSLANEGKIDVFVTREIDRLARNLGKQLVIETDFTKLGVEIEYVFGDYEDSPEGQLNKHIRAVIAEYEREKIKERLLGGRRRKAKAGFLVKHGNVPYGYQAVEIVNADEKLGEKLTIDEAMAQVVRMIFEWYTVDGWGSPTIARELNRRGVLPPSVARNTKSPHGVGWTSSAVLRIVANETYAGKWRYGKRNKNGRNPEDHHIPVDVPAIVSEDVFRLAQQKRKSNTIKSKRNTKREYLLGRRCRCGNCQTPMVSLTRVRKNGVDSYSYYRCPVYHAQRTHYMHVQCDVRKYFRADYWDARVWHAIKEFLADPERITIGYERYIEEQRKFNKPIENRIAVIDGLLEQKTEELSRLLELYLAGSFDQELLIDHKHRLEEIIEALKNERESLSLQIKSSLTQEQLDEIQQFSQTVATGFLGADTDFDARKRLFDFLGVEVSFHIEDDVQVAYVFCDLGKVKRLAYGDETSLTQTSSRPRGSEQLTNFPPGEAGNCMPNYKHSMDCRRS